MSQRANNIFRLGVLLRSIFWKLSDVWAAIFESLSYGEAASTYMNRLRVELSGSRESARFRG